METTTIIIARSFSQELFYFKKFKNEKDAIAHGEQISRQGKAYIITYLKDKKSGHRWEVDIFESTKEGMNISSLIVNSKKSAKLAAEALKEYDDTLRIYINKIY